MGEGVTLTRRGARRQQAVASRASSSGRGRACPEVDRRQRERLLLVTTRRAIGIATVSHRRRRSAHAVDVLRDFDVRAHEVVVHLVVHDVGAARQRDLLDHILVERDTLAGSVPATIDLHGRGRKGRGLAHGLLPRAVSLHSRCAGLRASGNLIVGPAKEQ